VEIKKHIREDAKVIILGTTITNEQYKKITEISTTSQVMLANYSPEMTLETLALFRQIGLTDYDFVPYYPGKPVQVDVDIAVTPGEAEIVPQHVKSVIDIGHRTLDMQTIAELAVDVGREDLLNTDRFVHHFKLLKNASNSMSVLMDRANIIESQFFKLLNVIDEGIIATEKDGTIFAINDKAQAILGLSGKEIGQNIQTFINHEYVKTAISKSKTMNQKLIQLNNNYLSFKAVSVQLAGMVTSILFVINRFEEKEKNQHKLRSQILGKGHVAKYTFDDILGHCPAIAENREMANRMARSDASVLVMGESGTGKELFAQAIHNASKRHEYQFVAINCAAIPENLLESELFGYEEGAFTGAKKGGKMGLFELAHNGTLFLDEIGEMPVQLQGRLLRVIQEKEVMRIGGDQVICIDVRIIAATNKHLKQRVREHHFRSDLYYRLNVLTLKLPPLRERGQDILYIFETMVKGMNYDYTLSSEAETYLLNYTWEGNLREMKNCVDYLAYIEKPEITLKDLQYHLDDDSGLTIETAPMDGPSFILKCLYQSRKEMKGMGRREILKQAKNQGQFIGEAEIRRLMQSLADEGLVTIGKGRGGSTLTQKGIVFVETELI